jgi:hypothetical protein
MIGRTSPALEKKRRNPLMPNIRTVLTFAFAAVLPLGARGQAPAPPPAPPPVAASPAPAATVPPTEAERTLDVAIGQVKALKTVSAEINQTVDMLEQHFTVTGQYRRAEGHRLSLRLSLSGLGDTEGTMLQICDGTTLWDYSKILDSQNYRRLEIGKVLKRLESAEFDATTREYATAQLGFSGPDALLSGLRKAIKFERKEAATLDGRSVWFLQGSWKDVGALAAPGQAVPPVGAPLPPYVPSLASVWIGQDDGWPYQVLLEGRVPTVLLSSNRPKLGPDGRPTGRMPVAQKEPPSKFLLTYHHVELDRPIAPEEFAFQAPPNARVYDQTEERLAELERASQMIQQAKKAEAASKEEANVLDGTLKVPTPPARDEPPSTEEIRSSAPPPK